MLIGPVRLSAATRILELAKSTGKARARHVNRIVQGSRAIVPAQYHPVIPEKGTRDHGQRDPGCPAFCRKDATYDTSLVVLWSGHDPLRDHRDLRCAQVRSSQGHLLAADGHGTLEFLDQIAVERIARRDELNRRLLDREHASQGFVT